MPDTTIITLVQIRSSYDAEGLDKAMNPSLCVFGPYRPPRSQYRAMDTLKVLLKESEKVLFLLQYNNILYSITLYFIIKHVRSRLTSNLTYGNHA